MRGFFINRSSSAGVVGGYWALTFPAGHQRQSHFHPRYGGVQWMNANIGT